MILHGIFGRAFERDCIRGFARLSDLAKASWADYNYQRNFDDEQIEAMLDYLRSGDAFFPEVILSYKEPLSKAVIGDISIVSRVRGDEFGPAKESWKVNEVDGPEFSVMRRKLPAPTGQDRRGVDDNSVLLVTIQLDETKLAAEDVPRDRDNPGRPFFRVDGNHRLIAGSRYNTTAEQEPMVPFCLLMLPNGDEFLTIERLIFSNINSKSLPLTQEQLIRAGISDERIIDDTRLRESPYGPAYVLVRKTFPLCEARRGELMRWNEKIEILDEVGPEQPLTRHLGHLRTILRDAYELLLAVGHRHDDPVTSGTASDRQEGITVAENTAVYTRMVRALIRTKRLYEETPQLKYSQAVGLISAFVRYAFEENEFLLQRFKEWALNNHIDELPSIRAHDAVDIFERIRRARSRTIFVSMPFDGSCEPHFKVIQQVVEQINKAQGEHHRDLLIKPVRVDQLVQGHTQKISDAIFREIQQSGMLIADLTNKNANVYHEVGYLMGLARQNTQPTPNLLFICNTRETKVPQDIGFNLRDFSIVTFRDTIELAPELKKHIEACYATGDAQRNLPKKRRWIRHR